jgi:hypothetical protein
MPALPLPKITCANTAARFGTFYFYINARCRSTSVAMNMYVQALDGVTFLLPWNLLIIWGKSLNSCVFRQIMQ